MQSKSSWDLGVIPLGALLVTVIVLPYWTYDPVSSPKLFLLTLTAAITLGVFINRGLLGRQLFKDIFPLSILVFALLLTINVLINNEVLPERLFGVRGRSTGLITYISFAIISLIASQQKLSEKFFSALLISNLFVSGYFTLQVFELDKFVVEEFYSSPSSTLGNPNFVSGFVGFSIFSALYFLKIKNIRTLTPVLALVGLNLFVLIKSASIQGVIALVAGISTFVVLSLVALKKRGIAVLISIAAIFPLPFMFFGLLGRGPLANILASSTTFSRLDYWRAAIRMLLDHPIFGVGLDGYRDSYRLYRDEIAINRFGASQTADSAHNTFLDMFSAGGFPLGITFLFISILPACLVLQKVVRAIHKDRLGILLLSVWVAFQVQAMSSVPNLGVGIWGWFLLGTMISHAQKSGKSDLLGKEKKKTRQLTRKYLAVLTVALGFATASPQLLAEARFLRLANQGNGLSLTELVLSWPQDSARINLVAQGWRDSGELQRSKQLVLVGIEKNPNYYPHWELLLSLDTLSSQERLNSLAQLRRLDPLVKLKNPE
jgi:O-antigen ligase